VRSGELLRENDRKKKVEAEKIISDQMETQEA
jgi:hypothetical protein